MGTSARDVEAKAVIGCPDRLGEDLGRSKVERVGQRVASCLWCVSGSRRETGEGRIGRWFLRGGYALDGSTENVVRLIDHCDDHHASDAPRPTGGLAGWIGWMFSPAGGFAFGGRRMM